MNSTIQYYIRIRGVVQGVGFRPFVYRLATELAISGDVRNDGEGVTIHACGTQVEEFVQRLQSEIPPLAVIDSFTVEQHPLTTAPATFTILQSSGATSQAAEIPADICICDNCAAETVDKSNRRFGYPFTNCTDCGPRYTIVSGVPYDRPKTSMHSFPMCETCQKEYDDPASRRFHAQPNACPVCGPQLELEGESSMSDSLSAAAEALKAGKIVALRGLGGYHLAVDACNEAAVQRLRRRKNRPEKPLAVMCFPEALPAVCRASQKEVDLINSPLAPIVLCHSTGEKLAPAIAPGLEEIGLMRPSTPLHHLLLHHPACPPYLVMTSGNHHGNPICRTRKEARQQLGDIANLFLHHNREILTRVDDSVAKIAAGRIRIIRRSRGCAPASIPLTGHDLPLLLACGAAMKNSFCLAEGNRLIPGQHIGELENPRNFDFYLESITHLEKLCRITPQRIVCDLHPDYPSSRFAEELAREKSLPLIHIQHHHAHAVAVLAEHGLTEAMAIVLDGTGHGDDGTSWGGELLHVTTTEYTRLAHLVPLALPGGDRAATQPWRMALSALHYCQEEPPVSWQQNAPSEWQSVQQLLRSPLPQPQSSSAGRLFDAVASLLGVRQSMSYESQAAMELERRATAEAASTDWKNLLEQEHNQPPTNLLDPQPILLRLLSGTERPALTFHTWLAAAFARACVQNAAELRTVVLAGGCMQNRLLLEMLYHLLEEEGFQVYAGEKIPMNDGGIAVGQALAGGLRG